MQQGQQPPPQPQPEPPDEEQEPTIDAVVALLRNDKLRSYQIDVETDSTIFQDAEQEKASRTELLTAMAGFVQQWGPVSMGSAPMTKLGFDMLEFGVRGFQSGRHLEDALEECREAMLDSMDNPAPPQPDPAVEREKIKMEGDQKRLEADMQLKGMDMKLKEMDVQAKGADLQMKQKSLEMDQDAKTVELQFKQKQMEMDLTGKRMGMEYDSQARMMDMDGKKQMHALDVEHTSAKAKAKPEGKREARKVTFERGPDGRIVGASIN